MKNDLDPFDFVLAEKLHMTVEDMQDRMSNVEYNQWRAFYVYRNAMFDLEAKTAQNKAKRGKRR